MCTVQHVQSVFTFQPMKRLVSTTVKNAKPAVTFWIFLLRSKNRQLRCLVVPLFAGVVTTKNHLHFWRNFSSNHNQAHPNLNQKRLKRVHKWNKRIRFLLADYLSNIFVFQTYFIQFQYTVNHSNLVCQPTQNHRDLLSLQRRNPVDSRFWTRLCYYCSKWSQPNCNSQLTRSNLSCLANAVVSKARFFGQSFASSSHNS